MVFSLYQLARIALVSKVNISNTNRALKQGVKLRRIFRGPFSKSLIHT